MLEPICCNSKVNNSWGRLFRQNWKWKCLRSGLWSVSPPADSWLMGEQAAHTFLSTQRKSTHHTKSRNLGMMNRHQQPADKALSLQIPRQAHQPSWAQGSAQTSAISKGFSLLKGLAHLKQFIWCFSSLAGGRKGWKRLSSPQNNSPWPNQNIFYFTRVQNDSPHRPSAAFSFQNLTQHRKDSEDSGSLCQVQSHHTKSLLPGIPGQLAREHTDTRQGNRGEISLTLLARAKSNQLLLLFWALPIPACRGAACGIAASSPKVCESLSWEITAWDKLWQGCSAKGHTS